VWLALKLPVRNSEHKVKFLGLTGIKSFSVESASHGNFFWMRLGHNGVEKPLC
jgi:hypothetical protein